MNILLKTFVLLALTISTAFAGNLFTNSEFSKSNGWNSWVKEGSGTVIFQEGKAIINTLEAKGSYDIQLGKEVSLEVGKNYKLQFNISTETSGKLIVSYLLGRQPYTTYAYTNVSIVPGDQKYECILKVKGDPQGNFSNPSSLRFALGTLKGSQIILSNVSLSEVE